MPIARRKPHRIDVHHHIVPPSYLAEFASRRVGSAVPWTPELSIEDMDKSGIAISILSLIQPGVWLGEITQARHRSMLQVMLGETLEQKRSFDQIIGGRDLEIRIPHVGPVGICRSRCERYCCAAPSLRNRHRYRQEDYRKPQPESRNPRTAHVKTLPLWLHSIAQCPIFGTYRRSRRFNDARHAIREGDDPRASGAGLVVDDEVLPGESSTPLKLNAET